MLLCRFCSRLFTKSKGLTNQQRSIFCCHKSRMNTIPAILYWTYYKADHSISQSCITFQLFTTIKAINIDPTHIFHLWPTVPPIITILSSFVTVKRIFIPLSETEIWNIAVTFYLSPMHCFWDDRRMQFSPFAVHTFRIDHLWLSRMVSDEVPVE